VNPSRFWQGRERYTVFDTAYGDGTRAAALIDAWRKDPERPARLHIVALAEGLLPGFHRIPQREAGVTLDLLNAPFDAALAQLAARIDFVQLSGLRGPNTGFARGLARLAASDARLAFDWLEQEQVAALMAQGFVFEGGGARFASRKPRVPLAPVPPRHAVVIGAGLAGCAAAERLCARGWEVTLVERHAGPAQEASGNLAGIFMPLLSKDDNIPTRLTRDRRRWPLSAPVRRMAGSGAGNGAARPAGARWGLAVPPGRLGASGQRVRRDAGRLQHAPDPAVWGGQRDH
jgi:tRNA 5-methylaminomethyl-2-thiouridine biosynthesis bifunctional protein